MNFPTLERHFETYNTRFTNIFLPAVYQGVENDTKAFTAA